MFAEASWYGSLRGGVMLDKGQDAKFYDGASRWGIRGSNEISEGLSSVYRFEHKFSTEDAGQAGGRLAYVGLSGGFGSLTLGQIWSASYNHAGVIRDIGNWYSSPDTSARIGNTLSYAYSNDAFSVQFDAIMDGKKDTGKAVDQWELGATVNIGDIGKVAFAHVKMENEMEMGMDRMTPEVYISGTAIPFAPKKTGIGEGERPVRVIELEIWINDKYKADYVKDGWLVNKVDGTTVSLARDLYDGTWTDATDSFDWSTQGQIRDDVKDHLPFIAPLVHISGNAYKGGVKIGPCRNASGDTNVDKCTKVKAYYGILWKDESGITFQEPNSKAINKGVVSVGHILPYFSLYSRDDVFLPQPVRKVKNYGSKSNHLSASFEVGGVTLGLGHSTMKSKDPMKTMKEKTNYVGASGGIGDTGLDWRAWYRNKKDADGKTTKPWGIGLGKDLGGGAWAYVEHWNDGVKGTKKSSGTVVGLGVNF